MEEGSFIRNGGVGGVEDGRMEGWKERKGVGLGGMCRKVRDDVSKSNSSSAASEMEKKNDVSVGK